MKSFFYYLCKRLAAVLPLLLVLPFMTFCLMHLMPGNYFDSLRLNPQISPETIKKYEALYHLDKPLLAQYFHWLENIVHLDFGYSFAYKQPVLKVLASRLWNTFLLSGVAFAAAWFLAVILGLWAGMRRGSWFDRTLHFIAYTGLSMPAFLLSILFLAFAAHWGSLPLGGMKSVGYEEMSWPLKCQCGKAHGDSRYRDCASFLGLSFSRYAGAGIRNRGKRFCPASQSLSGFAP